MQCEVVHFIFEQSTTSGAFHFSLATSPDTDPVDICSPEQGFYRSGSYGKSYGHGPNAGWIPYDEVEQIIRRCIDEYLQTTVA